ncbi:MAG: hypothetical protein KAH20_14570 [Methylococcales bacterium]|nr:hypothetical protein [Methylococcales bacterium]
MVMLYISVVGTFFVIFILEQYKKSIVLGLAKIPIMFCTGVFSFLIMAGSVQADEKESKAVDRFMTLGTSSGKYGGDDFESFERKEIKTQIKTFIPPLLRPAFTQHAFVLPPNVFSVSLSHRYTEIKGDRDFFKNGDINKATFGDFTVNRHLTDFDLFYGFDLNKKYLHGFTLRVNIPYFDTKTNGAVHPNGQQFIGLENAGSSQSIGDVGIFLKKKLLDQGNSPFGLAVVGAVFVPTGSHNDSFGSNGRITASRPQPPNLVAAQGFDAVQKANVKNGTWGDGRCFFHNFNAGHRELCDGPADGLGGAFGAPAAGPLSFAPGGANADNAFVGDFPFNNGVFGRFSGDGRLPSTLQAGTGTTSFMLGAFLTRQFDSASLLGRGAAHLGFNHRFVSKHDGVDFGDTTTFFASLVKPVYGDFLAVDLSFVGFYHQSDSYDGKIPEPEIHTCDATDIVNSVGGCAQAGDDVFIFDVANRPSFSAGFTGMIAPSLIFSPDPQYRMTLSGLFRVVDPYLGPAPNWVVRAALEYTF